MNKATQILEELNSIDEHLKIEAKLCTDKIDKSVLETICAFANEPDLDGGVIIIGVEATHHFPTPYVAKGVANPDKLQQDLASQCATVFNHPVRPIVEIETINDKKLLIVTVPELESRHKPLYFEKEGLPKGAWRRIGSTDQRCTEEDLAVFYSGVDAFDKAIAENTELEDLDENAINRYRQLRKEANPNAEELGYSDHDMLRALNAIKKDKNGMWRLTNTGLLVFGKQMALRREMPAMRVDYIRVPGTEWVPDPHNRFEAIDMRGSLLLLVNRAFNAIADDLPRGFSISPGNLQAHRPLSIPEDALREAIVNSLIHQSLRVHRPIQIIRYSNRIEITNAGFSLKPEETLGEPGSEIRNPAISAIFHETHLAEAKGTGIGTMRKLMKEADMMPPTFESDRGRNTFTVRILLHHFLAEDDVKWLASLNIPGFTDGQKTALIFLREVGALDNLAYRQLTGLSSREASHELKQMESFGLIEMKGQGRKTHYIPTDQLKALYKTNGATSDANGATSDANGVTLDANGATLDANGATLDLLSGMPEELISRITRMGMRMPAEQLDSLITDLCSIRAFSIEELAKILNRTENHIRNKILPKLLKAKRITFTIPEMVNHPKQKYIATS
ncbi:MAG: putative DNA binding domain-containing protein [Odoribacter sp.]|nr:putative DNA binding domain-containing protein [Odoribacter sp.]